MIVITNKIGMKKFNEINRDELQAYAKDVMKACFALYNLVAQAPEHFSFRWYIERNFGEMSEFDASASINYPLVGDPEIFKEVSSEPGGDMTEVSEEDIHRIVMSFGNDLLLTPEELGRRSRQEVECDICGKTFFKVLAKCDEPVICNKCGNNP